MGAKLKLQTGVRELGALEHAPKWYYRFREWRREREWWEFGLGGCWQFLQWL